MDVTPLRPPAPTRFRRGSVSRNTETLLAEISTLVAERQQLRVRGATAISLERNRLKIARAQWELSHALIRAYLPQQAARDAA